MNRMFNNARLRLENLAFAGTGGVSANNRQADFIPAFRDPATGRVEIARFEDGKPAPMHLLCGLPAEWVVQRNERGEVIAICEHIISGFVRNATFYTREEAATIV